jgi:hypothetical protein
MNCGIFTEVEEQAHKASIHIFLDIALHNGKYDVQNRRAFASSGSNNLNPFRNTQT